jgi:hypothetical protein
MSFFLYICAFFYLSFFYIFPFFLIWSFWYDLLSLSGAELQFYIFFCLCPFFYISLFLCESGTLYISICLCCIFIYVVFLYLLSLFSLYVLSWSHVLFRFAQSHLLCSLFYSSFFRMRFFWCVLFFLFSFCSLFFDVECTKCTMLYDGMLGCCMKLLGYDMIWFYMMSSGARSMSIACDRWGSLWGSLLCSMCSLSGACSYNI